MKLRGRLALHLAMPFLRGRYAVAADAVDRGHQPVSYHPDWWVGQQLVLLELLSDLRRGRVCSSPFAAATKEDADGR